MIERPAESSKPRLSPATLDRLPEHVARPAYALDDVRVGIVHLGLGAFHRGHQAVYTDDAIAAGGAGWGICGVSLRGAGTPERLAPQRGLYTLLVRSGEGDAARVVGSVRESLFAPGERALLLARLTDPATRVVSLTITEKGYCRDPASGALVAEDPGIAADLASPQEPATALGWLALALERRRALGVEPFAVMSCDNLPGNGAALRKVFLEFADRRDPALAAWAAEAVAFPSTMVDRIVPATTDDDRDAVAAITGLADAAPVVTEPFSQWVVEDAFPAGRPAWEDAGAIVTDDVEAFEKLKLRLLNGPHSALAYLGYLSGCATVSECMRAPALAAYARRLMSEEIAPTVLAPAGFDTGDYVETLLARFANPALRHRTHQIAMDGSQKLPQRLLGTLDERLRAGEPAVLLALAVAGWMRYVCGVDEGGEPIEVQDPHADALVARARPLRGRPAALADALLGFEPVFGDDAERLARLRAPVSAALEAIVSRGAAGAVAAATSQGTTG